MEYLAPSTQHTNMKVSDLRETCKFKVCERKKGDRSRTGHESGNKCTNFHSTTIKPPNGISNDQIKLLQGQFKKNREEGHTIKGVFCIEGNEETRHVHIKEILPNPTRAGHTTRKRYIAAIADSMYTTMYDAEKGNHKVPWNKGAINIYQPGKGVRENLTLATFLSYGLKTLARGDDGQAIIPVLDQEVTSGRFLSFGLFDGLQGEELKRQKHIFAQAIMRHWEKKLDKQRTHWIDGRREFHMKTIPKFIEDHMPEVHKMSIKEQVSLRPKIIATMYLTENEKEKYEFTAGFFKGMPKVFDRIAALHPDVDDVHAAVEAEVEERYARLDPSYAAAATDRTGKGALRKKLKELEAEVKGLKQRLKSEEESVQRHKGQYDIAMKLLSCEESYSKCYPNAHAKYFETIQKRYDNCQWKDEDLFANLDENERRELDVFKDLYSERPPPVRQSTPSPKRKRGE